MRKEIAEQLKNAVRAAAQNYELNAADEDSVTGGLVERLASDVKGSLGDWSWRVRPIRVSSNLDEGGEGELGADLVVQLDVYNGGNVAQKLVPIQAKNQWTGKDRLLEGQAKALTNFPGSGIVADYRPGGYGACRAEVAVKAGGNRKSVAATSVSDLGTMLGDDFLDCTIGTTKGYMNDANTEVIFPEEKRHVRMRTNWVARLKIERKRRPPRSTPPR